jgi:hypothetical protein
MNEINIRIIITLLSEQQPTRRQEVIPAKLQIIKPMPPRESSTALNASEL